LADETDNNRAMSVYLHYLANGTPIRVDTTSAESKAAIERGKELASRKLGETQLRLHRLPRQIRPTTGCRGQWLGEPKGQYDHFPTWRTSLLAIWISASASSGARSISAPTNCRPTPRNTAIWNSFLASQNDGQKLSVPGIRH